MSFVDASWEEVAAAGAVTLPARDSIQADFELFHAMNPHVYDTLVRLARQYRERTGTTPGIGMLFEVARWTVAMETRTAATWKLDNRLRSRYARRIMEQEHDLADAFETRRLRAA